MINPLLIFQRRIFVGFGLRYCNNKLLTNWNLSMSVELGEWSEELRKTGTDTLTPHSTFHTPNSTNSNL